MRSRKEIGDAVREFAEAIARDLGYVIACDVPRLGGRRRFCYARTGSSFATEVLCFVYDRAPEPVLSVDFLGTALAVSDLAVSDLEGVVAVESVFEYQFTGLGTDPSRILPESVELYGATARATLERLREEVLLTETGIWPWLVKKWERIQARVTERRET